MWKVSKEQYYVICLLGLKTIDLTFLFLFSYFN